MKKILTFIILINLLTSCQSAKEALTLKKKSSADEFLIEKKNLKRVSLFQVLQEIIQEK